MRRDSIVRAAKMGRLSSSAFWIIKMTHSTTKSALRYFFALATGTVALCVAPAVQAQTSDGQQSLAKELLTTYWAGDVKTQRAAEELFQSESLPVGDEQLAWAYVLNRLHYNKFREAATVAQSLIQGGNQELEKLYAHAWLQMTTNNIDQGLVALQQLKQALTAAPQLPEPQQLDLIGRMGRLIGFAEGPSHDSVNQATLVTTQAMIIDGWDDLQLERFEDQRQRVLETYNEITQTTADQVQAETDRAIAEQQQRIEQLTTENEQLDSRQQVINQETDKLRDEANSALSQLESQLAPLETEASGLLARINRSQSRIAWLAHDLAITEAAAAQETDPVIRDQLLRRAGAIRVSLFNEQSFLATLRGQYSSLLAQIDSLRARHEATVRQYGGRIGSLNNESRQLDKTRVKNSRMITRLGKPQVRTGLKTAMKSKAEHLPTYDPFPTSEFQQRLLQQLN